MYAASCKSLCLSSSSRNFDFISRMGPDGRGQQDFVQLAAHLRHAGDAARGSGHPHLVETDGQLCGND